ncbi:MAG TPA: cytochrome P450 [Micromonosporaceae bacterium]|nr:cytochrome P450 [Micromonosporaceae bacterium]
MITNSIRALNRQPPKDLRRRPLSFPLPEHGGVGPAAELAALRGAGPCPALLPSGVPALLVHGYAELREVVTDVRLSRSAAARHGMTARSPESLALNSADPPDHTRRRRAVAAAFTQRRADAMRPAVARHADGLASRMLAAGAPAELVADFTRPLAVRVICQLLGVPDGDFARFHPAVTVMMSTAGHPPDQVSAAHRDLFDYFADRYDRRRSGTDPAGQDVLTDLVEASRPGGPLTREEAVHVGYGLLIAGYETVTHQLAICAYLLLSDRSRWEWLRRNPRRLATAVEEMLRCTSLAATGGAPHMAREPTAVGAVKVPADQVVVPVFAAANRDPVVFEAPDELRLDRHPNPHVAFGYGRHLCLGAPLARVELTTALDTLLRRVPTLDLAEATPRWREGMFVRGLTALPVRW